MIRTKKSLGQNFLNSEEIAEEIVKTADIQTGDVILEIGPGTGVLTEKILKSCRDKNCKIIAVEKDDNLSVLLNKKFAEEIKSGELELINGDILDFETPHPNPLPKGARGTTTFAPLNFSRARGNNAERYKIIANIPYYITGQIIRKFLSSQNQPSKMVLMVQKEVAERIVAKDGKESILSISVKVYGKPKYIKTITADNFSPKPKVDSAILLIDDISKDFFKPPHPNPPPYWGEGDDVMCKVEPCTFSSPSKEMGTNDGINEEKFFELIKTAFSSKRKTLLNNLKNLNPKMREVEPPSSNLFGEILEKIGLSEKVRAENLSIDDWKKLYKNI